MRFPTTTLPKLPAGAAFWRKPAPETDPTATPELPDTEREAAPSELAIRHAHRNLIVTKDETWAYYVLDGVDWTLQQHDKRLQIITDQMFRWADMTGHRIWLRGTSSPYPHQTYAKRMYADNPGRLPDVEGARTWADMMAATQTHMINLDARRTVAVLGVRIATRSVEPHDLPKLLGTDPFLQRQGDLEKIRLAYHRISAAVSRNGFAAKPVNARSLRWLVHASVGIGAPVPAALLDGDARGWCVDDVPGFTNPVYVTEAPFAPTCEVRTMRQSKQHTSHVAVLHVGGFEPRNLDRGDLLPFFNWMGTLNQSLEFLVVADVIDGRDLKASAELDRRKARNTEKDHIAHDDDPPAQVLRGIVRAREVEDEVQNASKEVACRLRGVVMVAVTGPDEEATLQAAADVTSAASREQGIELTHDYGQYASYRAFTPGSHA